MIELIVNNIIENGCVLECTAFPSSKRVKLDVEDLIFQFKPNDKIVMVEHGMCDIFRNEKLVGGLTDYFRRIII